MRYVAYVGGEWQESEEFETLKEAKDYIEENIVDDHTGCIDEDALESSYIAEKKYEIEYEITDRQENYTCPKDPSKILNDICWDCKEYEESCDCVETWDWGGDITHSGEIKFKEVRGE